MSKPHKTTSKPEANEPRSDFVQKTAEEVRQQPVKALVWAFFGGIILTLFPVGRILSLFTRIAFGLLRPTLLLVGLVKISEVLGERRK